MESGKKPELASYQRCTRRIVAAWPGFRAVHADRLRHGGETEKVAEAIIEDLFTLVLDWSKGDLMYQVGYADIVVSHNLAKYLVIEVKRPGTLFPGRRALESAVAQACRYAGEQRISAVAATDGRFLYAADVSASGLIDRALIDLGSEQAPLDLWSLSVHGIYRPVGSACIGAPVIPSASGGECEPASDLLLHPKYHLPATCFAYVPDASRPATWKLPYLAADGRVDPKRLPKAIQAILSNYRGVKVAGIPETDIRGVLVRLAEAASREGHMPPRCAAPAPVYQQLAHVLEQLGAQQ